MNTICPLCESGSLHFTKIPEHRREWTKDGENFTEHMPECTDYKCNDCGTEFSILDETRSDKD